MATKTVKTALLLSNVINADHQNSCLFTNKGHFSSPLCFFIGVLAPNFMSNTLPIALTRLLEYILTLNSVFKKIDPYDHYAVCWVTLIARRDNIGLALISINLTFLLIAS